MKIARTFLTMLEFYLRLLPGLLLLAVPFLLLSFIFSFNGDLSESSGLGTRLDSTTAVVVAVFGAQLAMNINEKNISGRFLPLPCAEFLLTRPIPRYTAYLPRVFLLFGVMLLCPALKLWYATGHPVMELSLYHGKTDSTEAYQKSRLYQEQFPDSRVVRHPKQHNETLVIRNGEVLIALWETWIVILLALALQCLTLTRLPHRFQFLAFAGVLGAPFLLLSDLGGSGMNHVETAFFTFSHHWKLIALLSLAAFGSLQVFARYRLRTLELVDG